MWMSSFCASLQPCQDAECTCSHAVLRTMSNAMPPCTAPACTQHSRCLYCVALPPPHQQSSLASAAGPYAITASTNASAGLACHSMPSGSAHDLACCADAAQGPSHQHGFSRQAGDSPGPLSQVRARRLAVCAARGRDQHRAMRQVELCAHALHHQPHAPQRHRPGDLCTRCGARLSAYKLVVFPGCIFQTG